MSASDFIGMIFVSLLMFLLGICVGAGMKDDQFKRDCVERGVAQYNPKTAEWGWIVEKIKLEKDK